LTTNRRCGDVNDDGSNEPRETQEGDAFEPRLEAPDHDVEVDVEGFYLDPNAIPPGGVSDQQNLVELGPDLNLFLNTQRVKPPKYRKVGKHL
jgi:hypothetical protein